MARAKRKAPAATEDTAITSTEDTVTESMAGDTSFNPAEFDPAMQQTAHGIVEQVAEGMKMPDEPKPQTFAEKVGKREPGYTQQGTTDYIAGVRIHEYHDKEKGAYLSIIKFDEKPSKEVTTLLRKNGFDWSRENQEWNRPIRFETRQQDRITADEVFAEVCKLVRAEKGVSHSFGGQSVG